MRYTVIAITPKTGTHIDIMYTDDYSVAQKSVKLHSPLWGKGSVWIRDSDNLPDWI